MTGASHLSLIRNQDSGDRAHKNLVIRALITAKGDRDQAAERMGVTRAQMVEWVFEYGLQALFPDRLADRRARVTMIR